MAAFEYKALDAKGKHKKGTIEGTTPDKCASDSKSKG